MRILIASLLVLAFLRPSPVQAWSLHYLVTDRALSHASMERLSTAIDVEPFEAFVVKRRDELAKLFEDYYAWLAERGSKRFKPQVFDRSKPGVEEFVKAARLNPGTRFYLVDRVMPAGAPQGRELDASEVEKILHEKIQFEARFEDVKNQRVSARSVLRTFSDEPDWGMDRGLWEIPEYGYGEIPYGSKTGIASQAAFHMQFLHENWLVRTFVPEMLDGMAIERVELFGRLAQLAFEKEHPYWGFRFTAWALHYLQDICQPYHAKAVPHGGFLYYLRFLVSTDKEKFKSESTQLVKNRHFAYEDFVAHGLRRFYTTPEPLYQRLAGYLMAGDASIEGVPRGTMGAREAFLRAAEHAANHARNIDRAVVAAFGSRMTEDPAYDLEADATYSIDAVIKSLSAEAQEKILDETGQDFSTAGVISRTLVRALAPSL